MDPNVPYMPSKKNLHAILDAVAKAAVPEAFGKPFLTDLGFTSSSDRPVIKLLKYLGFLDTSGKPQTSYREFVNQTQSKKVLARQVTAAYDDLFRANPTAHQKSVADLKGWFKTKTGEGDSVAEKMAITFRSLCEYGDFSSVDTQDSAVTADTSQQQEAHPEQANPPEQNETGKHNVTGFGLVYRFEIHLPDTQNVDTYRAIFRAMREELR